MTIKEQTEAHYYWPINVKITVAFVSGEFQALAGYAVLGIYSVSGSPLPITVEYDLELTPGELAVVTDRIAARRADFEAEEGLVLLPESFFNPP